MAEKGQVDEQLKLPCFMKNRQKNKTISEETIILTTGHLNFLYFFSKSSCYGFDGPYRLLVQGYISFLLFNFVRKP